MTTCVLDADVVIGAIDDHDANHAKAVVLIRRLVHNETSLASSVVNVAEALVRPAADPRTLKRAIRAMDDIGISVIVADPALGREAARIRNLKVSLADAFALATALRLAASLATFDTRVRAAARTAGIALA